jgi:hypothetical protein
MAPVRDMPTFLDHPGANVRVRRMSKSPYSAQPYSHRAVLEPRLKLRQHAGHSDTPRRMLHIPTYSPRRKTVGAPFFLYPVEGGSDRKEQSARGLGLSPRAIEQLDGQGAAATTRPP